MSPGLEKYVSRMHHAHVHKKSGSRGGYEGDIWAGARLPKRSGFEAFASSASPFASVTRTKSPVLVSAFKLGKAKSPPSATSAFASYAGSNHGFIGLSAHKRQRADSPNGSGPNFPVRMATPVTNVLGRIGGRSHSSGDEAEGDDDEQPQSFSEKLRAPRGDEDLDNEDDEKLKLTEQDGISLNCQVHNFFLS